MELMDVEIYYPRAELEQENGSGNDETRSMGTFVWTIKNFSRWFDLRDGPLRSECQDFIVSPWFSLNLLEGNWWCLTLLIEEHDNKVGFGITRLQRNTSEERIDAEIELSFLASDGSILIRRRTQKSFSAESCFLVDCFVHEDEVLVKRRNEFLPNDTLTARCRIWRTSDRFDDPVVCFGRSDILLENGCYIFDVERFASLKVGQKHYFDVAHNVSALSPLTISICLVDDGDDVQVEFAAANMESSKYVMFEIFTIDAFGNIFNSRTLDVFIQNGIVFRFKHFLKKSELMSNKFKYLPNGSLILRCRYVIVYVNEIEYGKLFSKSIEAHTCVVRELRHRTEHNTSANDMQLFRDFTDIFKNNTLSDVNIRVGTEIFTAHKLILSARSPVFLKKFSTDLHRIHSTELNAKDATDQNVKNNTDLNAKDATDLSVKDTTDLSVKDTMDPYVMLSTNIDLYDLDADTMRVMLKYMYTDAVVDLDWNTATRLYSAADKYQMLFLKHVCAEFLRANLSTLNACEAMHLVDMHNDDDLKNEIQDFLLLHDNEIIHSEEWNSFKANHKQLALETIESLYLKKLKRK